jgi:hypothetical protein
MVAQLPTGPNQLFGPIPTVGQKIKLARRRQAETLKHPLGQSDFGPEATASFGPLGVIESSSEGQKSLFIEQSRQNPLVAKDISQVLGMILIPSTTGNLLSRFFEDRIVQEEKDD